MALALSSENGTMTVSPAQSAVANGTTVATIAAAINKTQGTINLTNGVVYNIKRCGYY